MSVFERYPDAFDDRQRPKCGVWSPLFGPCICGDPANHVEETDADSDARQA